MRFTPAPSHETKRLRTGVIETDGRSGIARSYELNTERLEVRHRSCQFPVLCASERDARAVLRALRACHDAPPGAPGGPPDAAQG